MNRILPLSVLLLNLGACATAPSPATFADLRDPGPAVEGSVLVTVDTPTVSTAARQARTGAQDSTGLDRSIWESPRFRRAFAQGFLAETDVEPGVNASEREILVEVRDLLGEQEIAKAIEVLEDESGEAENAQFDLILGKLYLQQEREAEGVALFRRATAKYQRFRRAWRELGMARVRAEAWEEGRDALVQVLELGGNDAVTYGLVGFCHANLGDFLSAETAFRMAVLLDPVTVDWKLQLTRALFEQRRFADAASMCGALIAEQPENAELWLLQANAFSGLDDKLRAIQNYEVVDHLGASTPMSLNKLANLYMHDELYDLAVDAALRALQVSPDTPLDVAARLASILTTQGEFDAARRLVGGIESLRALSLTDDERKDLLGVRAQLALAQGGGEEEVRALEAIVAIDPLDGRALIQLGRYAATQKQDPIEAAFYFERAAGIAGFEAEAKLRHAQLLVQSNREEEALPLLRSAQQLDFKENVQAFLESLEENVRGR